MSSSMWQDCVAPQASGDPLRGQDKELVLNLQIETVSPGSTTTGIEIQ